MKDKLRSEKVSMLNNHIQKVNTTTTPIESNYQPATRSLSNKNLHQETDNRHIIHLIGDSMIKAVNPELLLPTDVKTEIKKTHCYVLEELKDFTPDPQTKLIIIHCGTNNIAKCNNVDDALALIQENLIALKEKLPQPTQLIYSMIVGRGDEADQKRKEFNAHILLFCNKHNILICDHTNPLQKDGITPRFFIQDKVHLSVEGNKVFSANLSYALRMALQIPVIPTR